MDSVLLVDDEPAILRMVSLVLRGAGVETFTASDAEDALDLLRQRGFGLIVADVRLPGMDGVELTRIVKSDEDISSIPVLLMSAYGEPRDHDGDGFLAKPFDIEDLTESVLALLNEGQRHGVRD